MDKFYFRRVSYQMDPRIDVIDKRLAKIKNIIAVSGGKGGIGKSTVAAILALTMANKSFKVGLLDLDFWGPSAHLILGTKEIYPKESKGIIPPEIYGIQFMSIVYYTMEKSLALRRAGFTNAVIELLTITQWSELDYLIMDMPPGIGDATLDVIRLMKRVNFCVITTPSKVVIETVKKTLRMLKQLEISIIGVIENMKTKPSSVRDEMKAFNISFLGEIGFDPGLEDAMGDSKKLLETDFAKGLDKSSVGKIINHLSGKPRN